LQAKIDEQAAELLSRRTEAAVWEVQNVMFGAKILELQTKIDEQAAELLGGRTEA